MQATLPALSEARSQTLGTYERLRADILACRLKPAQRLKIAELCERLDVSLGAVREALSRLTAEGLVVAEAQKSYQVVPVSRAELLDLTDTRIEIESLCIKASIAHGDLAWETGLVAAWHRLSRTATHPGNDKSQVSDAWALAHAAFHQALVAGCESPWRLRIRGVLYEQSERYRRLSARSVMPRRHLADEHQAIFEATIGRNGVRASALLEQHLQQTTRLVLAAGLE